MKKKELSDGPSKMCMTHHVMIHSIVGLGLGMILTTLLTNSVNMMTLFVLGVVFCVLGVFSHIFLK